MLRLVPLPVVKKRKLKPKMRVKRRLKTKMRKLRRTEKKWSKKVRRKNEIKLRWKNEM